MNTLEGRFFRSIFLSSMLFGLVLAMPVMADGPVEDGPVEDTIAHYELLLEFNQGLLIGDAASKPYVSWLTLQPGYFFESALRLDAAFGIVFVNPGTALIVGGQATYRFIEPNIPIAVNFGIEGLIDIEIGNQDFEYLGSIITAYLLDGLGGISFRWGYEFDSEEYLISLGINIAII